MADDADVIAADRGDASAPTRVDTRFDVFLSHNSKDKPAVLRLAEQLRARKLRPWLDAWALVPGADWQDGLARGLRDSTSCAVFLGGADMGAWQRPEVKVALDRAMHDASFRVFLVLLPGMPDPFDPTSIDPFLSMRTWVDLRAGVDDLAGVDRLTRAVQGMPNAPAPATDDANEICPYRGLLPFREGDSALFFGRDRDVQRLVEKLKTSRFLAVVGPSGSGKSSVTLAGLIPALRAGALPGSEAAAIVTFKPGPRPLESLTAAILEVVPTLAAPALLEELRASDTSLSLRVRAAGAPVVLVVDQAEEAFTLCRDPTDRARFFGNLLHASTPDGPCIVVVTIRADFYPHAAAYPTFAQALATHQYLLGPLDRDELRQVIEQPALAAGLALQPGLVEVVLEDVAKEPGALPLLEHALLELWERRQGGMLTLAAYAETGGVAGAVSTRADEIWSSFSATEQAIARRVLLRLTQPGEGSEDTRRPAALDEMTSATVTASEVERVVQVLADARLLTTSGEHDPIVEVSHEALIRGWPRLRGWIEDSREDIRTQRRISNAAAEWAPDRASESLWRGGRLATASEWETANPGELNEVETEFLAASRSEEQAQSRRKRRRVITVLVALSVLTAAAVVLLVLTLAANRRASDNEREANEQTAVATAQALAARSRELAAGNPALALALAAEATQRTPAPIDEATTALQRARIGFADRHWQPLGDPLRAHTDVVMSITFSPDGRTLASASWDGSVRLWDVATGDQIGEPLEHTDPVKAVAYSPDGARLATASGNTVHLWDPTTGRRVGEPLSGHTDEVTAVAFNNDGTLLASGAWDNTVRLWDPATGQQIGDPLTAHTDAVADVKFNPAGTLLASTSGDSTIKLWTVTGHSVAGDPLVITATNTGKLAFNPSGTLLASASGPGVDLWYPASGRSAGESFSAGTDFVYAITFSPDGELLATAGDDGQIRTWRVADHAMVGQPIVGHTAYVQALAFNGDGTMLASGGADETVRLWDPAAGQPITTALRSELVVNAVAFSPDGSLLASGGLDDTVHLWDADTGAAVGEPLTGHTGEIEAIAYSPDGSVLASAGWDNTIRLWDPSTGQAIGEPLLGHTDLVNAVAFNPSGTVLASASWDNTIRLWDPRTGAPIGEPLTGHTAAVMALAFSPDGSLLVSGGLDDTLRLWDTTTWTQVGPPLTGHGDSVFAVAFSPDGERLATSSGDQTVRLWDLASRVPIGGPLTGHTARVTSVSFSPDGKLLASGAEDETVRLWDAGTGQPIGDPLNGHSVSVNSVAFSPRGTTLASAGSDGTVLLWAPIWDVAQACQLVVPYVEAADVAAYLPEGLAPTACWD